MSDNSELLMATSSTADDFLQKCKDEVEVLLARCAAKHADIFEQKLTHLQDHLKRSNSESEKHTWLMDFTKVMLDFTHSEENELVERDFKGQKDKYLLDGVLASLDVPFSLSSTLKHKGELKSVLTPEVTECIHWRKGALCYMYCATVMQDDITSKEHVQPLAGKGIGYLEEMLKTRQPLSANRDCVTTNSEEVFELLRQGIYSDTHVLALMYAGELCYWVTERLAHNTDSRELCNKYKKIGHQKLTLYQELANGPLQGWDTRRASELLVKLK